MSMMPIGAFSIFAAFAGKKVIDFLCLALFNVLAAYRIISLLQPPHTFGFATLW